MKLAFDIDGVLADFDRPFADILEQVTKRSCPLVDPDCWEWPEKLGFSKVEEQAAWQWIDAHPVWWAELPAYADAPTNLAAALESDGHDLYFITARHGPHVQAITAAWLKRKFGLEHPTVLLCKAKGLFCRALHIEAFIDDKPDMAVDVKIYSPKTRVYLRQRTHNTLAQPHLVRDGIILVDSATTFLNHELSRLRLPLRESPHVRAEHSNQ